MSEGKTVDERLWHSVPAEDTRLVWKCPKCGQVAFVPPEDATIPFCTDGDCEENEMEYDHTEVRI